MQINAIVLGGFSLLASVAAFPQDHIFARQTKGCNRDNCLRALVAKNVFGGQARGSAGCSSFFQSTVIPCPTPFSTTTTTITVPTFAPVTSTTTSFSGTITSTSTLVISGSITTVTVSATTAAPVGPAKRLVVTSDICTPLTTGVATVPSYASACSGTVRYASACSCLGITRAAITQSGIAISLVVTSTETVTASAVQETIILTTVVPTTTTTILTSTIAAGTSTVTVTVQPQSSAFAIYNSITQTGTDIVAGAGGVSDLAPSSSQGISNFFIDSFGFLRTGSSYVAAMTDPTNTFSVLTVVATDPGEDQKVTCALSEPLTSSGRLTCSSMRSRVALYMCPNSGAGGMTYRLGTDVPATCEIIVLRTTPSF